MVLGEENKSCFNRNDKTDMSIPVYFLQQSFLDCKKSNYKNTLIFLGHQNQLLNTEKALININRNYFSDTYTEHTEIKCTHVNISEVVVLLCVSVLHRSFCY